MRFNEVQEGDYRIYVGAIESPAGDGYTAAVVVNRVRGPQGRLGQAWRDDSLAFGYRWPSAEDALHYALNRARELIRARSTLLAC